MSLKPSETRQSLRSRLQKCKALRISTPYSTTRQRSGDSQGDHPLGPSETRQPQPAAPQNIHANRSAFRRPNKIMESARSLQQQRCMREPRSGRRKRVIVRHRRSDAGNEHSPKAMRGSREHTRPPFPASFHLQKRIIHPAYLDIHRPASYTFLIHYTKRKESFP